MAAATNSLQKNLEDLITMNVSGMNNNRQQKSRAVNLGSQQGRVTNPNDPKNVQAKNGEFGDKNDSKIVVEDGAGAGVKPPSNATSGSTPIYYKEQTVNTEDKLYDVMILIKPKSSSNTRVIGSNDTNGESIKKRDETLEQRAPD